MRFEYKDLFLKLFLNTKITQNFDQFFYKYNLQTYFKVLEYFIHKHLYMASGIFLALFIRMDHTIRFAVRLR